MKILVDADACPVKEEIIRSAEEMNVQVVMVASINHFLTVPPTVEVVSVDTQPEAADMVIVERTCPGDLVVTQDWGLSALILARQGIVLSVRGAQITETNIDYLLARRHQASKWRRAGKRIKGPTCMTQADRERFEDVLRKLLAENKK